MIVSDKIAVQEILELCMQHGLSDVVLSPGSRNAPFIISFTQNDHFTCHERVDERSAGFYALGMAQQTGKPVILTCTSGSAALNYAPAIVEAHVQGVPLLVITSDRPANGFEIGEGQCFNQVDVFSNYIKHQVNLVENSSNKKVLLPAFESLVNGYKGPVHINVPFNEPLYGLSDVDFIVSKTIKSVSKTATDFSGLVNQWDTFNRILILVAQGAPSTITNQLLNLQDIDSSVYIMQENLSNTNHPELNSCIDRSIKHLEHDIDRLKPDLIITIGHNIISKMVKHIFRKYQPKSHWSFHNKHHQNVFEIEGNHVDEPVTDFFSQLLSLRIASDSTYRDDWKSYVRQIEQKHYKVVKELPFSDMKAFDIMNEGLPSCSLQYGNSSVVRYGQLYNPRTDISYYGNRGVSGIEGCSSTAVGFSTYNEELTVLISGDLSFFYDSNAFWNAKVNNLLVVVMNNDGGSIFKIIDGPNKHQKALPYFTASQSLSIDKFCNLHDLTHTKVQSEDELTTYLNTLSAPFKGVKVLEIDTRSVENEELLKEYFTNIKPI